MKTLILTVTVLCAASTACISQASFSLNYGLHSAVEELFSGLKRFVIENSPNAQVPQYGEVGQTGDEGGEFIFIRKQGR